VSVSEIETCLPVRIEAAQNYVEGADSVDRFGREEVDTGNHI
jgi:hypothetical protein